MILLITQSEITMTQSLELKSGFVGIIHYTLLHEDGGLIESSVGRQPQPYLHGADNLMPGLEAALAGKVAGDIIKGQAAPKEAFGEHNGQEAHRVKRNELPNDREWVAGMPLQVQASNGQVVWLWIENRGGVGVVEHKSSAGRKDHHLRSRGGWCAPCKAGRARAWVPSRSGWRQGPSSLDCTA